MTDTHFNAFVDGVAPRFGCDSKALSIALQAMKDCKPDVIVHGGDLCDMASLSPHAAKNDEYGQVEGVDGKSRTTLIDNDIKMGTTLWDHICRTFSKAEKHQMEGNHDRWAFDQLNKRRLIHLGHKGLRGFDWRGRGINYHRYDVENGLNGPILQMGKLCIMHGHGAAKGTTMVNQHDTVVFGHAHSITYTPQDKNHVEKRRGYGVGCLCDVYAPYCSSGGAQNGHVQGFAIIDILSNDLFHVWQYEIKKEYVTFGPNGKIYYAKLLREIDRELGGLER